MQPVRVIAHGPGDGNDDHASATGGHCAGGDQGGEDQHKQNQHPNEDRAVLKDRAEATCTPCMPRGAQKKKKSKNWPRNAGLLGA